MRSNDIKKSTQAALERYSSKQIKKPRSSKNKQPEKQVVKELLQWLASNGFDCFVVESKAVYSQRSGSYTNQQAQSGTSDIIGCTPDGYECRIEAKAPGRRNSLKTHQRDFLMRGLTRGCFAACVDSVHLLSKIYSEWLASNKDASVLINHLPTKKESHQSYRSSDLDLDL